MYPESLIIKTKEPYYLESGYSSRLKKCVFIDGEKKGFKSLFPIISPVNSGKNCVLEQFLGFTILFCYVITYS